MRLLWFTCLFCSAVWAQEFPRLSEGARSIQLTGGTVPIPVGLCTMVRVPVLEGDITPEHNLVRICEKPYLHTIGLGVTWEDMQPTPASPTGDVLRRCVRNLEQAEKLAGRETPLPIILKFYFYKVPEWTMAEQPPGLVTPVLATNKLGMTVLSCPPRRTAAGNEVRAEDLPLSTDPGYHAQLEKLMAEVDRTLAEIDPDGKRFVAIHYVGPAMNSNQMRVPYYDLFPNIGNSPLGCDWTKQKHIQAWINMAHAMGKFDSFKKRAWIFNFTNLGSAKVPGAMTLNTAEQASVYHAIQQIHPDGSGAVIAKTESLCVNFNQRLKNLREASVYELNYDENDTGCWRRQMLEMDQVIPYKFIASQKACHAWENWAGFSPGRDLRSTSLYPLDELIKNSLYLDPQSETPQQPQGTLWVEVWPQEAINPDGFRRFDDSDERLFDSLVRWDNLLRSTLIEAMK